VNLLFINQFFWPDTAATGQLLADVARAVAPGDGLVTVLCGRPDYGAVDDSPAPPVVIRQCGPARFSRGKVRRVISYASFVGGAVWKAAREPRADVVVTLTTPPLVSLLGTALKMWRRSRHYIWEMDVYPDIATDLGVFRKGGPPDRIVGMLADWSRKHADGIIALGDDMKERLVARGVPGERIHVCENWADGEQIRPEPMPGGPLKIHYSGNFGMAHDLETICDAIQALRGDDRFQFSFAGGGPRLRKLKTFAPDPANHVAVRAYCSRNELGASLGAAHLGLVTQLPQTAGSVVPSKTYGIMAAGRPLLYIGPKNATPARIIDRFRCGWQVDSGNVRGLVSLLDRLASQREELEAVGGRARAAFEKHYDRPAGVARIQDVLGVSAHGSAADKVTTSGGCKDADDSLRAAGVHAESEIAGNTVA
jgi:colanic acid biosynthesis glycosyl transferase WcaI